jgi:hypothetical protein
MSDTSTHQEADEEVDQDDVGEDEQPEIEAEEMADLSAVADEIEDAAGASADDQEASDDVDGADQKDVDELGEQRSRGWGDMYVTSLTTGLNAVIEERGKPDAEPVDEQMARDLHLDEAFDEWMAQRGRSEMDPGQEVLLGTLILASSTLATKTDIVGEIAADIGGEGGA